MYIYFFSEVYLHLICKYHSFLFGYLEKSNRELEIKHQSNSITDSICCWFFKMCFHPPSHPFFTLLLVLHITLPRLPSWTHTLYIKLSLSLDQQQLRAFLLVPLVGMVHLKYNIHSLSHVYLLPVLMSTNLTFKKDVNLFP